MNVVGIGIKKGNYNGNDYHNVVFHGLISASEKGFGNFVEQVKVNYNFLLGFLKITQDQIPGLVGREILFAYDKYGKVEYVTVLKDNPAISEGA